MNVTLTFSPLPSGWCPSTPQDMANMINQVVTGQTSDGKLVKVMVGVFLPGFCYPTPTQWVEELNKVISGFVMSSGDQVSITFGPSAANFCWNLPQTVVDALASDYNAYVQE